MPEPLENRDPDVLLSSRELCDMIGVSLVTLSRWRSRGTGPSYVRLAANKTAYTVGAVREWLASRTVA